MDLAGLNDAQRCVVSTLPGPLFVSAGAGSGKTFTLKLRTANALLPNEAGFTLDSIEEVLAITFTDKAAAELLSRIKDTLVAEGMPEQALLADSAWISTIHGMAQRILRECALEIGLDPEFQPITEVMAEDLRTQARQEVIRLVRDEELDLEAVTWNWRLLGRGQRSRGLVDDAEALASRLRAMPGGRHAYARLASDLTPRAAMERLAELGEEFLSYPSAWGGKVHKSWEQPKIDAMEAALPLVQDWLASSQATLSFADDGLDKARFRELLAAFPVPTPSFARGKEGKAFYDAYARELALLSREVDGILGQQAADAALRIACAIEDEYARLKAQRNVIDNDDMLRLCLEAFREHPEIAERYRKRFRLIMVDEFQDTDKVQIEILRHLAAPGFANVCVVGDAQQSIYRFRGADVDAFMDYREALRSEHADVPDRALLPELADNYRSHADILAFVDSIFSQESAFGEEYLQLEPSGSVNEQSDRVMDARPRIELDIIHYRKGARSGGKQEALERSAAGIARYFASLKSAYEKASQDDGEQPAQHPSMALLLGVTTNAQAYIDALRAVGLEAMMTSGSVLSKSKEAQTIHALARFALNTQDEQPLFDILTSDLFAITDDDLLRAAHYAAEDGLHQGRLARGFGQAQGTRGLELAQEALRRFVGRARRAGLASAIRRLLVESGLVTRAQALGVDGLARIGNLSKTLALLEDVERGSGGLASTVRAFEAKLASANESPGILTVEESDFVQIMTIHGSKGLQFDHVAVADFKTARRERPTGFLAENAGDATYAIATRGLAFDGALRKALAADFEEGAFGSLDAARTPGELLLALERVQRTQEAAEARRLLYVGLTRAVRSLHLSYVTDSDPTPTKGEPYAGDGIFKDVHRALGWDTSASAMLDESGCAYGGSRPARVSFAVLGGEDDGASSADDALEDAVLEVPEADAAPAPSSASSAPPFRVPVFPEIPRCVAVPSAGVRADVRSYTSLSASAHDAPRPLPSDEGDGQDAPALRREEGEDATALGTAFHLLAQRAIIERAQAGGTGRLAMPDEARIRAFERRLGLTSSQGERLRQALRTWFASDACAALDACESVEAEVPFMVRIEAGGAPFFLEGEIDALGTDDGRHALLVDYKTGGTSAESAEAIADKHRFQAQCYAYALLRSGYESVRATFVRVEHPEDPSMPCDAGASGEAHAGGIQKAVFAFSLSDAAQLEDAIIAAHAATLRPS